MQLSLSPKRCVPLASHFILLVQGGPVSTFSVRHRFLAASPRSKLFILAFTAHIQPCRPLLLLPAYQRRPRRSSLRSITSLAVFAVGPSAPNPACRARKTRLPDSRNKSRQPHALRACAPPRSSLARPPTSPSSAVRPSAPRPGLALCPGTLTPHTRLRSRGSRRSFRSRRAPAPRRGRRATGRS